MQELDIASGCGMRWTLTFLLLASTGSARLAAAPDAGGRIVDDPDAPAADLGRRCLQPGELHRLDSRADSAVWLIGNSLPPE
jgi:hypothetical protein